MSLHVKDRLPTPVIVGTLPHISVIILVFSGIRQLTSLRDIDQMESVNTPLPDGSIFFNSCDIT